MPLTVENLKLNDESEEMMEESGGGDESDDEEMMEESGSGDDDGSDDGDSDPEAVVAVAAAALQEEKYRALAFEPSTWPPEWEEIDKSPQFLNGMITRFVPPTTLEEMPPIPDSDFQYPRLYRGPRILNFHERLKARIRSIRESRGYDVDHGISGIFLGDPFRKANMEDPYYKKLYDKAMKFVLGQINSHAKPYNKRYELVEIKKIVMAWPHRSMLITFSVNEFIVAPDDDKGRDVVEKIIQAMVYAKVHRSLFVLREWRFKPEATSVESRSDGA